MPSNEELLDRLEKRFARGEVSEHTYRELKESVLSRSAGCPDTPVTEPKASPSRPGFLEIPTRTVLHDRFILREKLGEGAFGVVYLAVDQHRAELVALKVASCSPEHAAFIMGELSQMLRIRERIAEGRNIIQVHDAHLTEYERRPLVLLSTEYAPHGSLRRWLVRYHQDRGWRHSEGIRYFTEACLGVQAIHDAGLSHLDLKPENLLLSVNHSGQPIIKVSDWGMASSIECLRQDPTSVERTGFDSLIYWSPEQLLTPSKLTPSRKGVGFPSDIYTLGLILFEVLNGAPPFLLDSPDQRREKRLSGEEPQLEDVDDVLSAAVTRCLSKDPGGRFDNVQQLVDVLTSREVAEKASETADPPKHLPEIMRRIGFKSEDGVDATCADNRTPLHAAAASGDSDAVLVLLAAEADVNVPDDFGVAPLHLAAGEGHKHVAEILLSHGANVDAVCSPKQWSVRGWTSLHHACNRRHEELVQVLLDAQADVTLRDCHLQTPLHIAVAAGHMGIIRTLLQAGADANALNITDMPMIHVPVSCGNTALVQLLVQHGADCRTFRDRNNGHTLLHVAAEAGHKDVVALLLQNGTGVNAMTSDGLTPYSLACDNKHQQVADLIYAFGGDRTPDTAHAIKVASQGAHRGTALP